MRHLLVCIFLLLSNYFYGQAYFGKQNVILTQINSPKCVVTSDLDGDGDSDILVSSSFDQKISWFENIDSSKVFKQHVISDQIESVYLIRSDDLDNDGDQDIVFCRRIFYYWGIEIDYTFGIFENVDGKGNFGPLKIFPYNLTEVEQLKTGDIDSDGDVDIIVSSSQNIEIVIYENLNDTFDYRVKWIRNINSGFEDFDIGDIDGDNDIDLYIGGCCWVENLNGNWDSTESHPLNYATESSVKICDIDNDSDFDIIGYGGSNRFKWNENIDGLGDFTLQHSIDHTISDYAEIDLADFDNDGDPDIVVANENFNRIVIFENIDGKGNFSNQKNITTNSKNVQSICVDDLNQDGYIDIISASLNDDKLSWFRNENDSITFSDEIIITSNVETPTNIISCDIDSDGQTDIITSSNGDDLISWFKNADILECLPDTQIVIDSSVINPIINIVDIDNDNDVDILCNSSSHSGVFLYLNSDGKGNFTKKNIIQEIHGPRTVAVSDLNGDNKKDLIVTEFYFDEGFYWYENINGVDSFANKRIIDNLILSPGNILPVDMDHDSDIDLLVTSNREDKFGWYENLDSKGNFSEYYMIDSLYIGEIDTIDIDIDGDLDILSTASGRLRLYENINGNGEFVLSDRFADIRARNFEICDIDIDGDLDIIYSLSVDRKGQFYVLYNDSFGNFSEAVFLWEIPYDITNIHSVDIDNDADFDIFYSGYNIHYEYKDGIGWNENVFQIQSQPFPQNLCTDTLLVFKVEENGVDSFQWLELREFGLYPLENDSIYSGVNSSTLEVKFYNYSRTNNKYICRLSTNSIIAYTNYTKKEFNIICKEDTVVGPQYDNETYLVPDQRFDANKVNDCFILKTYNQLNNSETLEGELLLYGVNNIVWYAIGYNYDTNYCAFNVIVDSLQNTIRYDKIDLSIYPNPSNDYINIKVEGSEILEYIIFDSSAKLIKKGKGFNYSTNISIKEFDPGIYYIQLITREVIIREKIIKY